jgi:hypothetical protein
LIIQTLAGVDSDLIYDTCYRMIRSCRILTSHRNDKILEIE